MSLKSFLSDNLKRLESQSELHKLFDFMEILRSLQQRLNDDFFRIAVVGEFSSGKSTFINALIGRDILSHATTETTAALSRLINISSDDERNGQGRAYMKDGTVENIYDLSDIKDFTTTKSEKYKVAEEVDYVEIFVPILSTNQSIAIVDTPGLNGIAQGHLEQTIKIVQEAHACIYILSRRGLTDTDVKFLNEFLIPYQNNFIFVQNFMDEFNAAEDETVEIRINDAVNILKEKVFNDNDRKPCFFDICCVSALRELAGRDKNITRLYSTDENDLTQENREQLLQTSGFEKFRQILNDNFNQNELEKLKFLDMIETMINWCERLLKRIDNRQKEVNAIYQMSAEYKANQNWDSLKNKIILSKSSDEEALKGFISRQCIELKKLVNTELILDVRNASEEVKRPLNTFRTIEDLESYGNGLNFNIQSKICSIQSRLIEYCNLKLQEIYHLIKERLEEYGGIGQTNLSIYDWKFDLPKQEKLNFSSSNSIKIYNQRIEREENEIYNQRREISKNQQAIESEQRSLNSWKSRQQSVDNEHWRLGSRPQPRVYTESYEVEVERTGITGFIASIFCGSTKTETRYRDVTDDSKGEDWDRKKRDIENRQDNIRREIRAAERQLSRLNADIESNFQSLRSSEDKISRLKRDLQLEIEREEKAKRLARESHFKMCRSKMQGDLEKYFGDEQSGITQYLLDYWSGLIEKAKIDLQKRALKHFEECFKQKLKDIENSKTSKNTEVQQQIIEVNQTKKVLEDTIRGLKLKASEIA